MTKAKTKKTKKRNEKVIVTKELLEENPELREAGIEVGDIGEVISDEEVEVMTTKNKDFLFTIQFNNQKFEFLTEDLSENILSVKPLILKTKIILTLDKNGKRAEKQLVGFQAKQLFRNDLFRKIVLNRLILK